MGDGYVVVPQDTQHICGEYVGGYIIYVPQHICDGDDN